MCRVIAVLILVLTAAGGRGQTALFDANGFEPPTYTAGLLNAQNNWVVLGPSSQYTVQSVVAAGGAGQAVRATGILGNSQAVQYLGYTPAAGELVRVRTDVARTAGTLPVNTSTAYGISVSSLSFSQTTAFGLTTSAGVIRPYVSAPYNTTTGQFDPSQPVRTVLLGGAVAANSFVTFDAALNFETKRLRLSLNGTDVGADIPFADPTATGLAGADLNVIASSQSLDVGYWDNYSVMVMPVPEPALCLGLVAGGLVAVRGGRRPGCGCA